MLDISSITEIVLLYVKHLQALHIGVEGKTRSGVRVFITTKHIIFLNTFMIRGNIRSNTEKKEKHFLDNSKTGKLFLHMDGIFP